MKLRELVAVSQGVAGTRARLEKIARLAELLKRLATEERLIGIAYPAESSERTLIPGRPMPMQTLRARCSLVAMLLWSAVPGSAQSAQASTEAKLDLTPFVDSQNLGRADLIPVLAGDQVLVTSTLRLFAFDARTAELRWSAGPPKGWNELELAARDQLFEGVNRRQLWIAPAAGERVAVAALQLPQSRDPRKEWQGITIAQLPERRLFAYDLGSGRPLWDHAPPPDWDGSSGSYAQRMSVVSSPTVVGEQVLVACKYDMSSIDYHVACYELATGALTWSTLVARGEVVRNMFGRAAAEFASAPLVAVPGRGRVLAQTGLGTIAALDLATGEVVWRTEYHAIELPKTRSYTPPKREIVWQTNPPLVVGDVVLATPPDSRDLLALDLEDGRRLWMSPNRMVSELDVGSKLLPFDDLIGASEDTLYLGGYKVSALHKAGGLRSTKWFEPLWTERVERPDLSGRACLSREEVLLPGPKECLVLDRESGRKLDSPAMPAAPRGLLVTDGAIYALADDGLHRIER